MRRSIEAWSIDFMHAARALSRAPGFTAVTIVTLVLAIGSNAAIFSVVETVLLDPVKYRAADRLVVIRGTAPGTDLPDEFGPGREFYVQYGEQADMLEDLAMWSLGQTTVRAEDLVDRLFVVQATPTMFTTLSVVPLLGRLPVAEDDAGSVIVLSHWLWTSWFGSDPAVIGRSYEVSGTMRTVIGVMDTGFRFPDDRTALWIHLAFDEEQEIRPGNFGGNFIGRMKPGITHTDLESQLAVLASRLPERFGGNARYAEIIAAHRPIVRSLEEDLVGDIAKPLWLLLGTVGIVLLIACANVANLFMVRAEGRSRDMGVRQACGKHWGRGVPDSFAHRWLKPCCWLWRVGWAERSSLGRDFRYWCVRRQKAFPTSPRPDSTRRLLASRRVSRSSPHACLGSSPRSVSPGLDLWVP